MIRAYEFIARDRNGMRLTGIDESGLRWEGTTDEVGEAYYDESYFLEYGVWPKDEFIEYDKHYKS